MRERERGTIEHLLGMSVRPSEIALAKIWANRLIILLAAGTAVYLFAVTSLGILLATIANSIPRFALLSVPVFVIMFLLFGSFTPFESMPGFLQDFMYIVPSTHFVKFAQSVLYRGAGIDVVWCGLAIMGALGGALFAAALSRFRAMLARQN